MTPPTLRQISSFCPIFAGVSRYRFALLALFAGALGISETQAIPAYARSRGLSCVDCHAAPPKLNVSGEDFLARGYRRSSGASESGGGFPLSVWITGRHEDRSTGTIERTYVPKVELISGGPMPHPSLSYFIEWRVVSLDVRNNDTLRDRGGRFEDAFINWEPSPGHALKIGQFRALNQYDVSLRLSVSEPAIFSTTLAGDADRDARITGLRGFSASGRSPGIAYAYQSLKGATASEGLFHIVNVPFVGELSLPLSDEARREASHELEGPAKGVFLETFYRRGLNSIGAHAFVDRDRWLATALGRWQWEGFHGTAGWGLEDVKNRATRMRQSLELEYIWTGAGGMRPAAGFRVEQITRAGRDPAYIPYFSFSGPNTTYTFLLQLEARFQGSARTVFVDLSTLF